MKTSMNIAITLAFLATPLVPLAYAHGKPLPSAFGKELVPDTQANGGNDAKAEEVEEMHDKEDEKEARPHGRGGHGKRVHIQLDGDEDGGGTDDDAGGEF